MNVKDYIKKYRLKQPIGLYNRMIQEQKFDTIDDASDLVKKTIKSDIKIILEKYPDTKTILLGGSYAKGDYINQETNKAYIKATKRLKQTKNITSDYLSDRDYWIFPVIDNFLENIGNDINILNETKNNMIQVWVQNNIKK